MNEAKAQLIIEGPVDGEFGKGFFIRDEKMNVWDGSQWRGFGRAQVFPEFNSALRAVRDLRK